MVAGVTIKEFDLAAYLPQASNSITGFIGPATKGPVNTLGEFTDVDNYVSAHGRPVDRHYGPRAAIKFLRRGSLLKYVRIAGTLLKSASVAQYKTVGGVSIPLLTFTASSPGTWANDVLKVNIVLNGSPTSSYNIYVIFRGTQVERYDNLTNSTVENSINNNSSYIRVALHQDAGTTFPDSTRDSNTLVLVPMVLSGGNDGAFASSASADSSTLGLSAEDSWSYNLAVNATAVYTGSEGRIIAPGTLSVLTTAPAETFTDNGDGTLTGSAGGTGRVDYLAGTWKVTFNAAPTAVVAVSYEAGTGVTIGSNDSGVVNYSGTSTRNGMRPNSISISDSRSYQIDLGDGVTAAYTPNIGTDIRPGSVVISTTDVSNNTMTATDDGEGNLTGNLTAPGTITYSTGAMSFTFNANVKLNAPITVQFRTFIDDDGAGVLTGNNVAGTFDYQTGAWTLVYTLTPVGDFVPDVREGGPIEMAFRHVTVINFGDGIETDFTGTLEEFPVKAGSIRVYYAIGSYLADAGDGTLSGAGGTGTINYATGAISVSFTGAPAGGFAIYATYDSVILDFVCKYPGDIGNERTLITDGLFVQVDKSTNTPITSPAGQWYRVRVFFNNGTGAAAVETFNNLRTVAELISTINDATNGSELVTVVATGIPGEIDVAYDSGNGQKIGMAGAFTNADIIGEKVGPVMTGMQLFSNPETVPLHFLGAPGVWHRQVQLAGIEMAEDRNLVWLFSLPDDEHHTDSRDFTNGSYNAATPGGAAVPTPVVPYPPLATVDSSFAFNAALWVKYYDEFTNSEVWETPEGEVSKLIANTDARYETWFPIAGIRRGELTDVVDLRYSPSKEERAIISGLVGTTVEVINPFIKLYGQGIFLYGQQTMARQPKATDRLHVRWTVNIIKLALEIIGRQFVFELNDSVTWRELRSFVNGILRPIAAKRGLYNYLVVCDGSTNTPEVVQAKKLICKIFLQFVEIAEEIEFQLVFSPAGVNFSEVAPIG